MLFAGEQEVIATLGGASYARIQRAFRGTFGASRCTSDGAVGARRWQDGGE
jgi:hypothetical protein